MKDFLITAMFLPFVQIRNLVAYSKLQSTRPAKIGMFLTFIPVILVTTVLWAVAWTVILAFLRKLY